MLSPEKNDVDIKRLFNWNEEFIIYGVDGIKNETVFIRLLGDDDWNQARVKALRASAELRNKFNDPESDEYLAYIPIKELLEKESLVELMLILDISNFKDEIVKNLDIPFPTEPDADAVLEELEKYQEEVDAFEEKRQLVVKEELDKVIIKNRKLLNKRKFDNLYTEYIKNLVEEMCKEELNKVFLSYSVYYGTYGDSEFKDKYFESYEEYSNLPTAVKNQFLTAYMSLDIGVYNLKK